MENLQMNKTHTVMLMQLARLMPTLDISEIYNYASHFITQASNSFGQNPVEELAEEVKLPKMESVHSNGEKIFDQIKVQAESTDLDLHNSSSIEYRDSYTEISLSLEHPPKLEDSLDETAEKREKSILLQRSKKIAKSQIHYKSLGKDSSGFNHSETRFEVIHQINNTQRRTKNRTWKNEEDTMLIQLYEVYGPKWSDLGKLIGNKSGKQCRDRYLNTLRPGIIYDEWTEAEENLILELAKIHGKKWCLIASNVPGRTENQVKNKYYYLEAHGNRKIKRRSRKQTFHIVSNNIAKSSN